MKIFLITSAILIIAATSLSSCQEKKSDSESTDTKTIETNDNVNSNETDGSSNPDKNTTPGNEPRTFSVTFSPDSVYLGKNKEAFIKLLNAKAVELSDADGKIQGT